MLARWPEQILKLGKPVKGTWMICSSNKNSKGRIYQSLNHFSGKNKEMWSQRDEGETEWRFLVSMGIPIRKVTVGLFSNHCRNSDKSHSLRWSISMKRILISSSYGYRKILLSFVLRMDPVADHLIFVYPIWWVYARPRHTWELPTRLMIRRKLSGVPERQAI